MELGNIGEASIKVTVDSSGVDAGFDQAKGAAQKAGDEVGGSFSKGLTRARGAVDKAFLPAVGVLTGLSAGFMGAAKEAEGAAIAQSKLAGVMKNMGVEQNTKAVQDYANALGAKIAVDNDDIAAVQAQIATFGDLAKTSGEQEGYFNRITAASYDMASVFGGDASSAAIMLSKALNSPEQAAALTRTGALTKAEAEHAAALAKSGKTEEARAAIMAAVEKQVSGSAEKNVTGTQKMEVAYADMMETLGTSLLPLMNDLVAIVQNLTKWMSDHADIVRVVAFVVGGLATAIIVLKGVFMAVEIATQAWAAAQWLLNAAMSANPIGIIIVVIAALVAAIIYAWNNFDWFRNGVMAVWKAVKAGFEGLVTVIKNVIGWVSQNWPLILAIITGPMGLAVKWIVENWQTVVDFFSSIGTTIGKALGGLVDIITRPWKAGINFVLGLVNKLIDVWNGIEFTLPSIDAFGKTIGGFTIGTPDLGHIPQLADGGVVKARSGGTLALLGEAGRDEAVIPLNKAGQFGSNTTVNVYLAAGATGDPAAIKAAVTEGINETLRRGQMRLIANGAAL